MDSSRFEEAASRVLTVLHGKRYEFIRADVRALQSLHPRDISAQIRASLADRERSANLPRGLDIDCDIESLCQLYLAGTEAQRILLRHRVALDLRTELLHFSRRMATASLRGYFDDAATVGLAALSIEDCQLDFRESLSNLVLHFHALIKWDIDPTVRFRSAAAVSSPRMASLAEDVLSRAPQDRSLEAFFFHVADGGHGAEFRWRPPMSCAT